MVYVRKYKCNLCGDEFISRSDDEEYSICKCGKNKLKADYFTSYSNSGEFGKNFEEIERIGTYCEFKDTINWFGKDIMFLINECKLMAEELDWDISEWKSKMENGEECVTYINFTYNEFLNNNIECNSYEATFNSEHSSKYDRSAVKEWESRLVSLKYFLISQKEGKYDLQLRGDNHAMVQLNNDIENHEIFWNVEQEKTGHYHCNIII